MLITFAPDGSVEFTRNPTLLELFPDERKRIERMSLIEFDEEQQLHYMVFVTGPFPGSALVWRSAIGDEAKIADYWTSFVASEGRHLKGKMLIAISPHPDLVYFASYEDAVETEIAFIDYLRGFGHSFR